MHPLGSASGGVNVQREHQLQPEPVGFREASVSFLRRPRYSPAPGLRSLLLFTPTQTRGPSGCQGGVWQTASTRPIQGVHQLETTALSIGCHTLQPERPFQWLSLSPAYTGWARRRIYSSSRNLTVTSFSPGRGLRLGYQNCLPAYASAAVLARPLRRGQGCRLDGLWLCALRAGVAANGGAQPYFLITSELSSPHPRKSGCPQVGRKQPRPAFSKKRRKP